MAGSKYHNIDASGLRRGQYVGWGGGAVWTIKRNGNTWRATPNKLECREISGRTLADISAILDEMKQTG